MKYNPWPLGQIPKELQRQEPYIIRDMGYEWDDPRDIVEIFENKVAEFAGSRYAVAVDSCSHAIFLAMRYLFIRVDEQLGRSEGRVIEVPRHTYASVPQQIRRAGFKVEFTDEKWKGVYRLGVPPVYDGALRWTEGMFAGGALCLSFQIKKRIPIGRGGMILTNGNDAYGWLRLARHDGRDLSLPYDHPEHIKMDGWHYYMTPEDAARGIILMDNTPKVNKDQGGWQNYPPLHR